MLYRGMNSFVTLAAQRRYHIIMVLFGLCVCMSLRKRVCMYVNWCDKNYLYLNVSKMKEMCIDFRKITHIN